MQKFTTLTATAVPLKRSNIDTDQIIPANFLKRVTKTGYDDGLFYLWRQDPEFVLNQPQYEGAEVLVVGSDFGIGSSREHAVWALRDYGFHVVISPKFADIFRGNAGKSGLLAAQVEEADVERIWQIIEADPTAKMTVSLEERTISVGDFTTTFIIDDYTRWRLMEGHDDISLTLRHEQAISDFEAKRPSWMPRTIAAGDVS